MDPVYCHKILQSPVCNVPSIYPVVPALQSMCSALSRSSESKTRGHIQSTFMYSWKASPLLLLLVLLTDCQVKEAWLKTTDELIYLHQEEDHFAGDIPTDAVDVHIPLTSDPAHTPACCLHHHGTDLPTLQHRSGIATSSVTFGCHTCGTNRELESL